MQRPSRSSLLAWAVVVAATVTAYTGPMHGFASRSDALGDSTHSFVLASPIFSPKTGTSFTTLFTSLEDTSMSCLLRRYDAVGTLLTSQSTTIGAHGSLQASPAAHSGAPLHVEYWCPKRHIRMLVTYTDSGNVAQRIEPADSFEPDQALGGLFVPLTPARLCDTRPSTGTSCSGNPLGAGETQTVTAAGVVGIPSGASAVTFSAQAKTPSAAGYFTFFPASAAKPQISQVTFGAGETVTTTVTVKLSGGGAFSVYNNTGTANMLLDVAGYFT